MSLRKKAIRGLFWSFTQNWGTQLVSTIIFLTLARLLGPESFGIVAMASVFIALMQPFIDQGFSQAIIQRENIEEEHLDTAFWISLSISIALALATVGSSNFIAFVFREPGIAPVLSWLSLIFVFSGFNNVQEAILKRQMNFKSLALRSVIGVVLGGILGIGMAIYGFGVWSLVFSRLVDRLVAIPLLWSASSWRPRFLFSKKHFRELFGFGINVLGINFLNFFNRRSDDFLIGYYLGATALGFYSVAYKLLLLMTKLLTGATNQVALPTFSKLQGEPERLRKTFYKVTRLTAMASMPIYLSILVLSPELIELFFGEKWLPVVPVMRILAFIGILHSVSYFNSTVLMAMGKPSWTFRLQCLNAACNVLIFLLVVRWGIVAVAAAYVVRGYLLFPLFLISVKKLIDISHKEYLMQYREPLFCSLVMMGTMLLVKSITFLQANLYLLLVSSALSGIMVYLSLMSLFHVEETRFLLKKIRDFLKEKLQQKQLNVRTKIR